MSDRVGHDTDTLDGDTSGGSTDPVDEQRDPPEHGDSDDPVTVHPDEVDREFDWRGWTLVGAILVAFLVVPGIIYLYPRVGSMFGLTFWDTYLALPMIPAVILGILAVWATTRP